MIAVPGGNRAATFRSNSNGNVNFDVQLLITHINRRGLLPRFVERSRASPLAGSFLLKPSVRADCHANHSKGVACEKIKYFPSNGLSAVRFVNSVSRRCGSPALSRMRQITTNELLSARHAQMSRYGL